MTRRLIPLIVLLFAISAAFAQQATINGKVINNPNYSKIQLKNLLQKKIVAESPINPDGSFSMTVDLNYPDYFSLQLSDRNYIMLILKPGDKVTVTYDASQPKNSKVQGSDLTQVLYQAAEADQQINKEYQECQKRLQQEQQELYKQIILKNLGKISTLLLAEKLPMDKYLDVHIKLAKSLVPYQKNPYVLQYIKNVNSYSKTHIGAIAPEIALPSPKGDTIRLSSLRGKYVLVDFWASWCRPCRVESPNLVAAYNKYHDKGFTIFSVSLDNNRQSWINAIEKDDLGQWYHVSDLKGWHSSAAAAYGVTSIPSNFLLDPQGKIIARNLRGQKLQQTLEQIFKNKK